MKVKPALWQAYWEGYKKGYDVEDYDEYDKRAARSMFEQWYDRES